MRRSLLELTACAVLLGAAAGADHFARGGAVVLSFTEAELQERASALPSYTRTYLGVVQVMVENPRVSLVDGADRVRAGSDVAVSAGLGGRAGTLRGSADASGGVRYDRETGAFHLTDVAVERIDSPACRRRTSPASAPPSPSRSAPITTATRSTSSAPPTPAAPPPASS